MLVPELYLELESLFESGMYQSVINRISNLEPEIFPNTDWVASFYVCALLEMKDYNRFLVVQSKELTPTIRHLFEFGQRFLEDKQVESYNNLISFIESADHFPVNILEYATMSFSDVVAQHKDFKGQSRTLLETNSHKVPSTEISKEGLKGYFIK